MKTLVVVAAALTLMAATKRTANKASARLDTGRNRVATRDAKCADCSCIADVVKAVVRARPLRYEARSRKPPTHEADRLAEQTQAAMAKHDK